MSSDVNAGVTVARPEKQTHVLNWCHQELLVAQRGPRPPEASASGFGQTRTSDPATADTRHFTTYVHLGWSLLTMRRMDTRETLGPRQHASTVRKTLKQRADHILEKHRISQQEGISFSKHPCLGSCRLSSASCGQTRAQTWHPTNSLSGAPSCAQCSWLLVQVLGGHLFHARGG